MTRQLRIRRKTSYTTKQMCVLRKRPLHAACQRPSPRPRTGGPPRSKRTTQYMARKRFVYERIRIKEKRENSYQRKNIVYDEKAEYTKNNDLFEILVRRQVLVLILVGLGAGEPHGAVLAPTNPLSMIDGVMIIGCISCRMITR